MTVFNELNVASLDVPVGSLWKHRKGGVYRVVGHGLIEADLTPAVIYESLTGDAGLWIRPIEEFLDGRFKKDLSRD